MTKTAKFVNEYDYTIDGVREMVGVYTKRRCTKLIIATLLIIAAILAASDLVSGKIAPGKILTDLLILLLALVILAIESWWVYKRSLKLQTERVEVMFRNETPHVRVEVTSDNLTIKSSLKSGEAEKYPLSLVKKVFQTDNYIVIVLKGALFIAMDKRGFDEGNWQDAWAYLNNLKSGRGNP